MRFPITAIKKTARSFLETLDREKIFATGDLEANLNQIFTSVGDPLDSVILTLRPSNAGTAAYTISYTRSGTADIPIELKINPSLDYTQVILKAGEIVGSYEPFAIDLYDNIAQARKMESSDLSHAREELKRLSEMAIGPPIDPTLN